MSAAAMNDVVSHDAIANLREFMPDDPELQRMAEAILTLHEGVLKVNELLELIAIKVNILLKQSFPLLDKNDYIPVEGRC